MENNDNNLFDWNELIRVNKNAPTKYCPGEIAVICGMEKIKSEILSEKYQILLNDWIYTIEFGDGSSIEVPEIFLEKYES